MHSQHCALCTLSHIFFVVIVTFLKSLLLCFFLLFVLEDRPVCKNAAVTVVKGFVGDFQATR